MKKQTILSYQARQCKMHGPVVDVFFGGEKRGEIRQVVDGFRYRVTRCNFGPVYPTVDRVKQFIRFKNPNAIEQCTLV